MDKKRIVVIDNHALPLVSIRKNLMKAIKDGGHELFVLTGKSEAYDSLEAEGYHMIDVGYSVQNPISVLKYIFRLRKVLKEINPDIFLPFTIRPVLYGNLAASSLNIDTITNITGIGPLFTNSGLSYTVARTIYPFALRKTKKIFFQNFDDMEIFINKEFAPREICERLPGSGVNYKHYAPIAATNKEEAFSFVFISRLVKDKGIGEYVEAARIMRKKYSEIKFKVIGPFWELNLKANTITKEDMAAWEEEGIIQYLGEQKDIRPFVAAADTIVLPSYREGTSNVLLESASMAKPLITTNVTGCKEIVDDGETGFLCKVRDAEDLAEKMEAMYLLSEKEREEMGKRGREKVIKEFDRQIVIDAYLRAIQEIS